MFVQLLDEHGVRVASPEFDPNVAHLTPDDLLGFYRDMVVVRRLDAEATALQRQGELALWPPLLGQEAAQIGSGRALRADDFVFSVTGSMPSRTRGVLRWWIWCGCGGG